MPRLTKKASKWGDWRATWMEIMNDPSHLYPLWGCQTEMLGSRKGCKKFWKSVIFKPCINTTLYEKQNLNGACHIIVPRCQYTGDISNSSKNCSLLHLKSCTKCGKGSQSNSSSIIEGNRLCAFSACRMYLHLANGLMFSLLFIANIQAWSLDQQPFKRLISKTVYGRQWSFIQTHVSTNQFRYSLHAFARWKWIAI